MPAARIILLEFNELCSWLIDRWIGEGRLPNFARLRAMSDVYTTTADVEDPATLEPWIQWYSAHTGLSYDQHRVFHLTDGPRAGHPDLYATLLAAGKRVGSFASMNVAPFAAPGSFFVGDPWTEAGNAQPAELNIYNRFVAGQVREYSNESAATRLGEQARFVRFMLGHGLAAGTVIDIVRQLAAEKLRDRRLSFRRVAILDRLQFDLFRSLYDAGPPDFASFFLNSTAHLQHSYWRHLDPSAFEVRPDAGEMAVYGDAVRFGYEAMDRLVGRFLALAARHGATLMFMTGLSQQPFTRYESLGGQHFHRLHDVAAFLATMGIVVRSADPTMTNQYMLRFDGQPERDAARARLEALTMADGGAVFGFGRDAAGEEPDQLYFGCQVASRTDPDAAIADAATGATLRFGDLFYRIDAIKSGRHHPDGALWIARGTHRTHPDPVSILDLFPTVLDMAGVADPAGDRRGRSLVASDRRAA